MLDNIKSFYYFKLLFSYLNEKRKLKLIKYNKNLQDKINITLLNYRLLSERYIIYEAKDKVKEYNNYDELIFEGEYLNGVKNGRGKEYEVGSLIFEGEFLNGKRNGNGKEYWQGILKFEGQYLNGERNGKGKEYDENGELISEKEYLNGNILEYKGYKDENGQDKGEGKEFDILFNMLIYEGEYLNRKRHGKGKEYFSEKLIFEGEYKNNKRWDGHGYDNKGNIIYELKDGKGLIKEYDSNGILIFEYEYSNGEITGRGKLYDSDGFLEYEGKYLNGEKNGWGKEYNSYSSYEGEFLNGKKHGKGKEINKENKLIFEGEYYNDYRFRGKQYIKGILYFDGQFLFDNQWDGKGYDEKGNVIYELKNGTGKIKIYSDEGDLYFEGEYLNGKKNGIGKEFSAINGKLEYEGEYLNGKKHGKGKEYEEYEDDLLIFEGEYQYGSKFNGKEKKYMYGLLVSESEYVNGVLIEKNIK